VLAADDKYSLKGAWSDHVNHLVYILVGTASIISLERLKLESSNFAHR